LESKVAVEGGFNWLTKAVLQLGGDRKHRGESCMYYMCTVKQGKRQYRTEGVPENATSDGVFVEVSAICSSGAAGPMFIALERSLA